MKSAKLKLLVLKTDDVERLRDFYTLLGFAFVEERHGSGPMHYSAAMGDGVLEIYPIPDGAEVDTTTRLGFAIESMDETIKSIREVSKAVAEPKKTQWGLRAVVRDTDGRSVELYQE